MTEASPERLGPALALAAATSASMRAFSAVDAIHFQQSINKKRRPASVGIRPAEVCGHR